MTKSRLTLWQRLKNLFVTSSSVPETLESLPKLSTVSSLSDDTRPTTFAHPATPNQNITVTKPIAIHTNIAATTNSDWQPAPPITASDIEALLDEMGYQFIYHPVHEQETQSIHHFTMQVADKEHEWGCMVRYFSDQQLISVYSILPFNVPEVNRADMLAVIGYLNYDLVIGNLEMDFADGELRFKTSLDLEVTGLSDLILSYLLQSNFSLVSRLYETLQEVVNKSKPASDLKVAVDDLLTAQQEKTFYLMTDAVQ